MALKDRLSNKFLEKAHKCYLFIVMIPSVLQRDITIQMFFSRNGLHVIAQ